MFRDRVRQFNKRVLNPQMMKIARSSWTPLAIVRHVGRRSGKPYQTPIIVKPVRGGFAIALTYGRAVDWYQNVVAAGRCTIIWHGKEYATGKPEPIDPERGLRIFPFPERLILRLLGTHDFVRLMYQGVSPGGQVARTRQEVRAL